MLDADLHRVGWVVKWIAPLSEFGDEILALYGRIGIHLHTKGDPLDGQALVPTRPPASRASASVTVLALAPGSLDSIADLQRRHGAKE